MANGDIDAIIAICVLVPALVIIAICAIICYPRRHRSRKFLRRRSSSYSSEHLPQVHYVIDYSRMNRYQQQQQRLPDLVPVYEQSPPSYRSSQDELPVLSPIRTNSNVHQDSTMPPSYAEIFLTDR